MKVGNLGQKYDRIWASGVLHHLRSPVEGLKTLGEVLAPGGTIKIAVYPRIARAPALAGAQLARQLNVAPTREGLLWFRQVLFRLPEEHPAHFIYTTPDFYSLSGVRDLCFNPCEVVYSVAEAAAFVRASGLRLVRFGVGSKPEARFRMMGFTDFSDLAAWQETEHRYPGTFSDMYRILVSH
jgi:hypothetical protein